MPNIFLRFEIMFNIILPTAKPKGFNKADMESNMPKIEENEQHSYFSTLPDEIIVQNIIYRLSINDISNFKLVSNHYNKLAQEKFIWKIKLFDIYGVCNKNLKKQNLEELFRALNKEFNTIYKQSDFKFLIKEKNFTIEMAKKCLIEIYKKDNHLEGLISIEVIEIDNIGKYNPLEMQVLLSQKKDTFLIIKHLIFVEGYKVNVAYDIHAKLSESECKGIREGLKFSEVKELVKQIKDDDSQLKSKIQALIKYKSLGLKAGDLVNIIEFSNSHIKAIDFLLNQSKSIKEAIKILSNLNPAQAYGIAKRTKS